jgi:hypothetical protein
MEYEKDSRESTGVAFVLAVYAASRLFYLIPARLPGADL